MAGLTTLRGGAPAGRRRPGDSPALPLDWQLDAGPFDGRWGVQAVRYEYMNGQCRYCGDHCPGEAHSVTAHPRAACLACGTPQCGRGSSCLVCMSGYVGKPPWNESGCGYARCDGQAVASASRVHRVCLAHLGKPAVIRGQGRLRITLADSIAAALAQRDRGGRSWQKLAWNDPRGRDEDGGWHAERVELTPEIRGAIEAWQVQPSGRPS